MFKQSCAKVNAVPHLQSTGSDQSDSRIQLHCSNDRSYYMISEIETLCCFANYLIKYFGHIETFLWFMKV